MYLREDLDTIAVKACFYVTYRKRDATARLYAHTSKEEAKDALIRYAFLL